MWVVGLIASVLELVVGITGYVTAIALGRFSLFALAPIGCFLCWYCCGRTVEASKRSLNNTLTVCPQPGLDPPDPGAWRGQSTCSSLVLAVSYQRGPPPARLTLGSC
jgi:hypothetical protein